MSGRFGVGRVLGTSCRIWFHNLPRLMAITGLLALPGLAWFMASRSDALREWFKLFYGVMAMLPLVLRDVASGTMVMYAVTTAALTHAVFVAMTGNSVPVGRSLMTAARRFLPVVGVTLLVRMATWGLFATLILDGPLRWSPAVLYAVAGFSMVLASLFYLAVPVATAERRGILGSLVHSLRLSRGSRLRVLAIAIIVELVQWARFMLLFTALRPQRGMDVEDYQSAALIYQLASIGAHVVLSSLVAAVAAVTYRLLREDREGLGAEDLAKVFE